jgi:acyl-lipid omega-6 desaturase (Delta-12 desaturase)
MLLLIGGCMLRTPGSTGIGGTMEQAWRAPWPTTVQYCSHAPNLPAKPGFWTEHYCSAKHRNSINTAGPATVTRFLKGAAGERALNALFESSPDMVESQPETLPQQLARYRRSDNARGAFEVMITAGPFMIIWAVMWIVLAHGHWSGLLLTVPAAGLVVRLFMIQHDCGHGSFFDGRLANDWVGRAIGVVTLTPYDYWRRNHGRHHASSGNLDQRGVGDIDVLTVREFLARPLWRRILYRLYRHPIVMFGIGPAYLFILRHRLPIGMMRNGWAPWLSTMGTNAAIAILVAGMIWLVDVGPFLLVHLPIMVLAASIGVWFFYVQHQFEHTSWSRGEVWSFHEAALHGSSYYHLPGVLRWYTANIGVHHIHHLCSRIPYYRLPDVLRDHPELTAVGRITLFQSLQCAPLALWDEDARRLISFREVAVRPVGQTT